MALIKATEWLYHTFHVQLSDVQDDASTHPSERSTAPEPPVASHSLTVSTDAGMGQGSATPGSSADLDAIPESPQSKRGLELRAGSNGRVPATEEQLGEGLHHRPVGQSPFQLSD